MPGFNLFRRAQTRLAGIEQLHMIRKGQYQHPQSDGLFPRNNSVCWLPEKQAAAFLPVHCR
ncbi:transposase [Erwinia tracheiphila PSU-1]|nr:transposase [Erwinia tracheiphila PSU-1]